ncbi:MAG TPA: class I SAM-dependent methyltransferase, partial [Gemmataceae bacterium]|nr:class I SAM-dependent methyltransferase [Gemmataceae bacterium]
GAERRDGRRRMDIDTFRELLTPAGRRALADASALSPTEAGFLGAFEKLRKRHPAPLSKAALETVLLRVKARAKFSAADQMYFTRESLEQASGEAVSRYRAERFSPFGTVADLCCGIGADTLSLTAVADVVAVDSDPLRLAMAAANVPDRARFLEADALTVPLDVAAAFADPARRAEGQRFLSPADYVPPVPALLARFAPDFPLAFKIAPGVSRHDVEHLGAEVEFISVCGELKECVLWFGPLKSAAWRATVLPGPHTMSADVLEYDPPAAEPGEFMFDPDSAVIRAGLVPQLCDQLDAVPIEPGVAFLTGPREVASPFAACFRVEHSAAFHLAKLRDYLRERRVGRVTMLKRASELDVNDVTKKLKLDGEGHRVVILTRSLGKPWALVCERC